MPKKMVSVYGSGGLIFQRAVEPEIAKRAADDFICGRSRVTLVTVTFDNQVITNHINTNQVAAIEVTDY